MKKSFLFAIFALGAVLPSRAGLTFSTGDVNGSGTSLGLVVPYGQSPLGASSDISVSGAGIELTSVKVTLNISGGWNGDLSGYLSYNGTLVTLLNHVGTGSGDQVQTVSGFSTSGFNNVTLADGGAGGNIHNVAAPVSGISYGTDGGSLASLAGGNPNGTWTLFLSDNSQNYQSTLMGWSLDITAVPEPVDYALAIFGLVFVGVGGVRWYRHASLARQSI